MKIKHKNLIFILTILSTCLLIRPDLGNAASCVGDEVKNLGREFFDNYASSQGGAIGGVFRGDILGDQDSAYAVLTINKKKKVIAVKSYFDPISKTCKFLPGVETVKNPKKKNAILNQEKKYQKESVAQAKKDTNVLPDSLEGSLTGSFTEQVNREESEKNKNLFKSSGCNAAIRFSKIKESQDAFSLKNDLPSGQRAYAIKEDPINNKIYSLIKDGDKRYLLESKLKPPCVVESTVSIEDNKIIDSLVPLAFKSTTKKNAKCEVVTAGYVLCNKIRYDREVPQTAAGILSESSKKNKCKK